jgi:hypothetical protein
VIRAVVCAMALLVLGCETAPKTSSASQPHAQPGITFSNSDGSSVEYAVPITGGTSSSSAVRSEHSWLAQRYPGYKRRNQSQITVGQRTYDRLEIETADGQSIVLYFDITVSGELK